jgi:hypothetical protein
LATIINIIYLVGGCENMYENITYAELKKLPKQQKTEAWKELLSLNPVKKQLAEKFGVSPAIVYNMISRYVDSSNVDARTKPSKPVTLEHAINAVAQYSKEKTEQKSRVSKNEAAAENITFSLTVNKTVTGENARFFLNGIGSTLLNDQKYRIDVKITEK